MSRVTLWAVLLLGAVARPASAATSASLAPGGGLGALAVSVDVEGKVVRYASCGIAPCAASAASPTLPIETRDLPIDPARVEVNDVLLAGGRHIAHVRVPLEPAGAEALAWEALLAPGAPPLFAGLTGFRRGEPGERSGTDVRLLRGDGPTVLVIGEVREDLRICGEDATLLDPRGLDPATLTFHGATLQRLSPARREGAVPVTASPHHGPAEPELAALLTATGASSGLGPASALTDGDLTTAWTEGRPGRGQGEFVRMQAPFDVPIVRFAVTVAPAPGKGRRPPEGAAPETFYLATGAGTYEVTLPDDAWSHPGEAYDVLLPAPLQSSCVALVLADAFTRGQAHPEVTVTELAAYSAFDHSGATLAEVATALRGGDARASAAAGLLERAGPPGLTAMTAAYPTLDPAGRALAINVVASASSCTVSAPLLTTALSDADGLVREKALAKLQEPTCGREALPSLVRGLTADATRTRVAPLVAFLGRDKVLVALAAELGHGSATDRGILRTAVGYAARSAPNEALVSLLAGASGRAPDVSLEMLRALRDRLGEVRAAADPLVLSLLEGKPDFGARYLLADVLAALADAGDTSATTQLGELIANDTSPEVRAHAAEALAGAALPDAIAAKALLDPAPRVRAAALRAAAVLRRAVASAPATILLANDPWTFVRVAAASTLGALAPGAAADRALTEALSQLSPRVREQALLGLGAHGSAVPAASRQAVVDHLVDTKEDAPVRAAAAEALGSLCATNAAPELARLAIAGASSADASEVALGLAATEALGLIHPKDLASRFKALQAQGVRPDARAAAARAIAGGGRCPGS